MLFVADLRVVAPDSGPPPGVPPGPPPTNDSGIVRADRLAGNIGYIEIVGFPSPDDFKHIAELSQESLFHMRDAALPGTEAALRHMIESEAEDAPDYDQMTPEFADVVRQQAASVRPLIAGLGPIQSVAFLGPGWGNGDRFEVTFARGAQIWSLTLTADGKVSEAYFGPAPSKPDAASPAHR